MPDLLYYSYFFRYKQKRKNVKDLVDTEDYSNAKTQLENDIIEQETFYPNLNSKRDFNFGENIIMKHALNHLNATIDHNNQEYTEKTDKADTVFNNKRQSDIVKDALLATTLSDYSDSG